MEFDLMLIMKSFIYLSKYKRIFNISFFIFIEDTIIYKAGLFDKRIIAVEKCLC